MGYFYDDDKKTYCGNYKGFEVWGCGKVIGTNWYSDYYITIPRGKSRRQMMVKDSICRTIDALKAYVDKHYDELNEKKQ